MPRAFAPISHLQGFEANAMAVDSCKKFFQIQLLHPYCFNPYFVVSSYQPKYVHWQQAFPKTRQTNGLAPSTSITFPLPTLYGMSVLNCSLSGIGRAVSFFLWEKYPCSVRGGLCLEVDVFWLIMLIMMMTNKLMSWDNFQKKRLGLSRTYLSSIWFASWVIDDDI